MDQDMTSTQAAAYLGVSITRINDLAGSGKITRRRVGGFWIYSVPSLKAWKDAPRNKGGRPRKQLVTV